MAIEDHHWAASTAPYGAKNNAWKMPASCFNPASMKILQPPLCGVLSKLTFSLTLRSMGFMPCGMAKHPASTDPLMRCATVTALVVTKMVVCLWSPETIIRENRAPWLTRVNRSCERWICRCFTPLMFRRSLNLGFWVGSFPVTAVCGLD